MCSKKTHMPDMFKVYQNVFSSEWTHNHLLMCLLYGMEHTHLIILHINSSTNTAWPIRFTNWRQIQLDCWISFQTIILTDLSFQTTLASSDLTSQSKYAQREGTHEAFTFTKTRQRPQSLFTWHKRNEIMLIVQQKVSEQHLKYMCRATYVQY